MYRITPAGAGKSNELGEEATDTGDHPRRCGEKMMIVGAKVRKEGSPPQVRGKGVYEVNAKLGDGITPAGAGKRDLIEHLEVIPGDHPRRCGEKFSLPFLRMVR